MWVHLAILKLFESVINKDNDVGDDNGTYLESVENEKISTQNVIDKEILGLKQRNFIAEHFNSLQD